MVTFNEERERLPFFAPFFRPPATKTFISCPAERTRQLFINESAHKHNNFRFISRQKCEIRKANRLNYQVSGFSYHMLMRIQQICE